MISALTGAELTSVPALVVPVRVTGRRRDLGATVAAEAALVVDVLVALNVLCVPVPRGLRRRVPALDHVSVRAAVTRTVEQDVTIAILANLASERRRVLCAHLPPPVGDFPRLLRASWL